MVTGDNIAIAKQIAAELKLGTNIRSADESFTGSISAEDHIPAQTAKRVEETDGFAQVFPEHKFTIVKALQERGHIVGMTGDGVNDAPALGQANAGIAVSGATDAARAAAALVLTAPGISVIVRAVEEARKIFERMTSYAIYRITETIRIMFFVVLTMIAFNFYPITTVMIILLALLNDLPIMSIAYDNTRLEPKPVRWAMHRVLTVATTLGLVGVISTFGLLLIARLVMDLSVPQIQSLIYLKLTVAGHLTLFVARTRRPFYSAPYPAPILFVAVLSTQTVAVLLVGLGILVARLPWSYVGLVWGYALIWLFIVDWAKLLVYRHIARSAGGQRILPEIARRAFHPFPSAAQHER
jgi:H+-transporting ATPase